MNNSTIGLKILTLLMTALSVILIVVYVVLLFLNRPVTPSGPISYNMFFPEKTSEQTISYYNGNHFLKLNTTTQEVTSLTPNILEPIPDVSDVVWTSHGVYFRFYTAPTVGTFAENSSGTLFSPDYGITQQYWYAGYNSSEIRLAFTVSLSPHISVVKYGENVVYHEDGALWEYSKDGKVSKIIQLTNSSGRFVAPLHVSKDKIVVALHGTRESEIVNIDVASKKRTSVATINTDKLSGIWLFATNDTAYAFSAISENEQRLVSYSLSDNKSNELLTPFTGFVYREGADIYAMYTGKDDVVIHKLNGSNTQRMYQFSDKTSLPSSTHCFDSKCYFVNNRGIARLLSHDENTIANARLANSSAIEKVVSIDGMTLTRNVLVRFDNSYGMVVGQGDITKPYTELQNQLRTNNINPYDYTFNISQGRYAQPAN